MTLEEQDWIDKRRKYVTATETSCLLGLNPFSSAARMWKEKNEKTFTGNSYTFIGQLLEPAVVECVNYTLGREFKLYPGRKFYTDEKLRLGATPDARDATSILECKTTKPANIVRYSGTAPTHYVCQVMTQLMLTKKEDGYLALLGTDLTQHSPELSLPLIIYHIKRSPALIALIEQEVKRFWETVESGKKFRVCSSIKKRARLACLLTTERIL